MDIEKGSSIEMGPVFDIESFFNYDNPNLKQYKDLVGTLLDENRIQRFGSSIADSWSNLVKDLNASDPLKDWGCLSPEEKIKTKEYLMDKLKGELLIDLGCGSHADADIYDIQRPQFASRPPEDFYGIAAIIKAFSVGIYIGIDRDSFMFRSSSPRHQGKGVYGDEEIITSFENKFFMGGYDMLLTLARAPSDSANITINAIDFNLIDDERFHKALATEMTRVCRPGGIIFGANSESLYIVEGSDLFKIPNAKFHDYQMVYEKK